jgi:glycosyltransferase involved in cell wall biosynthesis
MKNKTKILHIVAGLSGGGAGSILYGYYKCVREKCDSDFVVMYAPYKGAMEEDIINNGSKIFYIPSRRKNYLLYVRKLLSIIKDGKYDIVYSHLGYDSFLPLLIAKLYGTQIRVAHSHTADNPMSLLKRVYKIIETALTKIVSTKLCACGVRSAKWTWGAKNVKKIRVVNNAIDVRRFRFNVAHRNKIRSEMQISETTVMCCCVARFTPGKNHIFLINVFDTILKTDKNYKLCLFGLGELENEIKTLVKEKGLENDIIFMGNVDNLDEYYNAFDVFLLPSKFEGVPVTVIESQTNGLMSIISDCISDEVVVTDLVKILPLQQNLWVDAIKAFSQQIGMDRTKYEMIVRNNGFDVNRESDLLIKEFAENLKKYGKNI